MGLYKNLQNEPVSRLAIREPVVVDAKDTLRNAIAKMREQRLGCVILVDKEGKPTGMFTESMLTQLLSQNPASFDETLENHASERCPWVKSSDKIVEVLEAMQLKNVRFLCVVDEQGKLTGLTGQKGLMEYVAEHFPGQVMVQRIGGTPYIHTREGA